MAIEITRPGKNSIIVSTPVMPAAGTVGFGDSYRRLIDYEKLGAIITNPVTIDQWNPATGTRIVSLDAGILVHTGLPNPGLARVIKQNINVWRKLPVPVIVHLVATSARQIKQAGDMLDPLDEVAGVELGLPDDISEDAAFDLVRSASTIEKPLLVRLPFFECYQLAEAVVEAGADTIVVSAAPRGTARDEHSGRLVNGRIYGPLLKPVILRMVGRLRRQVPDEIPIIGAGGIHSPQDARDYIDAGAIAVQVDTATWAQPKMLERISRDLGGWIATRRKDALMDEWHPDMSNTDIIAKQAAGPFMDSDDDT